MKKIYRMCLKAVEGSTELKDRSTEIMWSSEYREKDGETEWNKT